MVMGMGAVSVVDIICGSSFMHGYLLDYQPLRGKDERYNFQTGGD